VTEVRRRRTRAERPAFEEALLLRVHTLARKDPEQYSRNVFQIGRHSGGTEAVVLQVMKRWTAKAHLRWRTSGWGQLTPDDMAALEQATITGSEGP